MTETSITYTITSTNPECYNVIRTNLEAPMGDYCRLTVTNLTTKATFVILNPDDYIIINDIKYNFIENYSELSPEGFCALLNDLIVNEGITANIDNVNRVILTSHNEFIINEMSYNAKMIGGFYNDSFPITPEYNGSPDPNSSTFSVTARSVGFPLSTPILYLTSNLGVKCYDNVDELYCDRKIFMRVNNSFTAGYPIINGNAEFSGVCKVNSLSNIEFRLVDANMNDIKLLTPMYLSVTTESIRAEVET